jgi:hypothetical protein
VDELVITVAAVTNAVGNQALLELPVGVEVVRMMLGTAPVFVSLLEREPDVVTAVFWVPAADGNNVSICSPNGSDELFEVTVEGFPVVVDGSCPVMVGDVTITLVGGADVVCIVVVSPCPGVVVDEGG